MTCRLTAHDKRKLSSWVGYKVDLCLLYKMSRDGCSAATYHTKCDNRGPTVTIAYNELDFVFGGYTTIPVASAGDWSAADPKAFLFRLKERGTPNPQKYPSIAGCVYNNATYGPTFGTAAAVELGFFTETREKDDEFYDLNTTVNLTRAGYNNHEHDAAQLCGANYKFREIEVYEIKETKLLEDDLPWRSFKKPWSEETRDKMLEELRVYSPQELVPKVRVLLLGQVGAGKSSFFNTVNSAFLGSISSQAGAGSSTHSLTTQFRVYGVRSRKRGDHLNFHLCDTMGLEAEQGLDVVDFPYIIDGNIQDSYKFHPTSRITPNDAGFLMQPRLNQKIHVAALVLDGSTVTVMSREVLTKIRQMKDQLNQRRIPLMVLLTKVDSLCPYVAEDLSTIYHSVQVQEKVDEIAQLIGVPPNQVLPMKNYQKETEVDTKVDILCLKALTRVLDAADDFLNDYTEIQELKKANNRPVKESSASDIGN